MTGLVQRVQQFFLSRANRKNSLILLSIPLQYVFFRIICSNEDLVEQVYSTGIYPVISKFLRLISGLVAFPIGQVLILVAAAIVLFRFTFNLIRNIQNKNSISSFLGRTFIHIAFIFSITYFAFMMVWGINYHRTPLGHIIQLDRTSEYSDQDLIELCKRLVVLTNSAKLKLDVYSKNHSFPQKPEILVDAVAGFSSLEKSFPKLRYSRPSVKGVFCSSVMSQLGIGGIYFPFTGEANINVDQPAISIPFTSCHEMSHQLGFAKEEEANFVAFMACTRHPSFYFRYSGILEATRHSFRELGIRDYETYLQLRASLSSGVLSDVEHILAYWQSFQGPMAEYSTEVNDAFLKANQQEEGVESYSLMVELLMAQFKKTGLKELE